MNRASTAERTPAGSSEPSEHRWLLFSPNLGTMLQYSTSHELLREFIRCPQVLPAVRDVHSGPPGPKMNALSPEKLPSVTLYGSALSAQAMNQIGRPVLFSASRIFEICVSSLSVSTTPGLPSIGPDPPQESYFR